MSKTPSVKIPIDFEDQQEPKMKYRLIRIDDGRIMYARVIKWIIWAADGSGKSVSDIPEVGASLVLDPRSYGLYSWLTTQVTEITKQQDGYIKFKTKNSTYELQPILGAPLREDSTETV